MLTLDQLVAGAVRKENGCLESYHAINKNGYPTIKSKEKPPVAIHRQLYQDRKGVKLTSKQLVCHRCNNRKCIEIEHLYVGSNSDNMKDAYQAGTVQNGLNTYWDKSKNRTHCNNGHPWTQFNTGMHKGYRRCLTCHRERSQKKS